MKNIAIYNHAGSITKGLVSKLESMGCEIKTYTKEDMECRDRIHNVDTVFYFICGCCPDTLDNLTKFAQFAWQKERGGRVIIAANAGSYKVSMHGVLDNPTPEKLISIAKKIHKENSK